VVSSHILPEVEQTCDRVIIMARGVVKVDARPSELLDSLREVAPYVVEIKTPAGSDPASVANWLRSVPGVASASAAAGAAPANGWSAWRLAGRPEAGDLREAIASAAVSRGLLLRELRREAPTLERIFLQMIDAEEDRPLETRSGRGARDAL
jgi:ABC-2 type transport system ATP-binding protein